MKILIVYPPCRESNTPMLPLGLLYVAQSLIDDGHMVDFFDIALEKPSREDVLSKIKFDEFDLMIIGGIITTYSYVKWLTNEVKNIYPEVPIMAGGFVANPIPHVMFKYTGIDVICNGEGDITVKEYVSALEEGRDISNVSGLYIKTGDAFIKTSERPLIEDLDIIRSPFDAYKLLDMEKYIVENGETIQPHLESYGMWDFNLGKCRYFDILSGRGCVGRCTFCYQMFKGMRKHSVSYLLRHMSYLNKNYKINLFQFNDDLFVNNTRWVEEFCIAVKDSGMDIRFNISSRANMITDELLVKLKDAGCLHVGVGFESGSQIMLDSMKKSVKVKTNYSAYKQLKKYNMIVSAPTIQGMPDETKETLMETLDFIQNCNIDDAAVYYVTPYPNSEIYQYALKEGLIQDEDQYLEWISNSDASELKINLTQLSDTDLIYYHWILAEAIRKNKFKTELDDKNVKKIEYYKFITKHYSIKMLYHAGVFKLVWYLKNAVESKKKKRCAV